MIKHSVSAFGAKTLIVFFFLLGFTATALQIVYLRIFLSLFYGNELSIGLFMFSWMFWTATGSFLFGRIKRPERYVYFHLFLFSLIIPFTALALTFLRFHAQPIIGTLPGLPSTLTTAFVALIPFGLFSGGLFPLYASLFKKARSQPVGISGSQVYLWETVGSTFSGLLTGLVLIRLASHQYVILAFALLNFVLALYFVFNGSVPKKGLVALVFFFLFLSGMELFVKSETAIIRRLWDGLRVVDRRSSMYGQLTLTRLGESHTLYQDGLPIFTIPDPQSAEETVHYALLLHPEPQKVLLIGGGFSGALFEILKHPSVQSVDYVELDPEIVRLYRQFFPILWDSLKNDARVHIHLTDGRLYLRQTSRKYDAIITALPDPYTVQLNRFYTRQFFRLCAQKLRPDGILSFRITGSENYINENLARYIQCIHHSFAPFFKQMAFLPGSKIYFFLSNRRQKLNLTARYLSRQLKQRHIATQYVRDYFIAYKLMPDRVDQIKEVLTRFPFTRINSDFKPMAYFFDTILWTSKFSPKWSKKITALVHLSFWRFLLGFFLFGFILLLIFRWKGKHTVLQIFAPTSMFSVGFSMMTLELILVIAFQVEYGYIYYQIALFIALFMAGMAAGSAFALRTVKKISQNRAVKIILLLHASLFLLALFVIPVIRLFYEGLHLKQSAFVILTLISGGLGGLEFPLISKLYFHSEQKAHKIGFLYGWDLIGSLFGSLLSSLFLIPVFGLKESGYVAALLNILVFGFFFNLRAKKPRN